ncbi:MULTISPECIES: pyridoxal phosphate-dependent aminotransferase [Cohnella]|uniref:pyridoxal phosphate-dependent aminotransferase n=1 Tax=Cohnella TaxID=329857 RepID=UPI0009BB11C3|nr:MULTISPECIES: aminotransferase class I/II-fold pyridoxal phosphate-dependent enzyme [Cohnella]MBN2983124.1 aminotransferase class I/II-fold pyridoxal phosphate-dependent enzyme [Cohnella algarum]
MSKEHVAQRVRDIPPSGIRAFFELAEENNRDTISLGIGEPDFVTPEHVRAACIRALNEGKTKYTPNAGLYELREEIASYMHDGFGLRYEPANEVLVTVGTSEAVDLALRTCVEPGDEVLIHTPCYIAYSPIAHLHGAKVVEVKTSAEERFKLTARALAESLTPRSKALVVNFPNNPTGAVMTEEDWRPVAELAVRHDMIVISDEVYAELTYGARHASIASLPGMKERTIVINGFSKAFAMTGWRIGYACGGRELIGGMLKIHQYTAMCAPVLGQIAAVESLRNGLEAKETMKAAFDERRRMFVKGLREIGLPCHEPEGAFYVFPSIAHTGLDSGRFARLLLKEAGVAVVPGHAFGTGGEGHIRCSYAVSGQLVAEALERLKRFARVPERASFR